MLSQFSMYPTFYRLVKFDKFDRWNYGKPQLQHLSRPVSTKSASRRTTRSPGLKAHLSSLRFRSNLHRRPESRGGVLRLGSLDQIPIRITYRSIVHYINSFILEAGISNEYCMLSIERLIGGELEWNLNSLPCSLRNNNSTNNNCA